MASVKHGAKYAYAGTRQESLKIRLFGVIGLLTLPLLVVGYYNFLHISPWLFALFLPTFLVVLFYQGFQYVIAYNYRSFNIPQHKALVRWYWKNHSEPSVAVVIPAAGEDISVVRTTAMAAKRLRYSNVSVWILDDTKAGMYAEVARQVGVGHVNRPNHGELKKAGNVNYGLAHIPATDHVLILDADFVPRREMLREMVPYMHDPSVAILQTPQHFGNEDSLFATSKIAYGAAMIQEGFYAITQPARDRFDSAICVGTNALYRRSEIEAVGGFQGVGDVDPWTHSEDVYTGLKLLNRDRPDGIKNRIKYVPIQLAEGTSPETYYSFYKQQNRWCTGSLQLLFSTKTLFSRKLRPMQKLFYLSNGTYYLYTIALLLMPLQLFVVSLSRQTLDWRYTLLFTPSLLLNTVIVPVLLRKHPHPVVSAITINAIAFTFAQAIYLLFRRRPLGWEATGAGNGRKESRFEQLKVGVLLYFVGVYGLTASVALLNDDFGLNSSIFLQVLFAFGLVTHVIHMYYLWVIEHRGPYVRPIVAVGLASACAVALIGAAGVFGAAHDVRIGGNGVSFVKELPVSTAVVKEPVGSLSARPVRQKPVVPPAQSDITYTAQAGVSLSALASQSVRDCSECGGLPAAQKAYMQDYLMRLHGYSNVVLGQEVVFTAAELHDAAAAASSVAADNVVWAQYAQAIQLQ